MGALVLQVPAWAADYLEWPVEGNGVWYGSGTVVYYLPALWGQAYELAVCVTSRSLVVVVVVEEADA